MPKLNSDNVVVIRAWYPSNYGKTIDYYEGWLRRTFTPWNHHAHIGHIAMYVKHGDREEYISLIPTESHFFKSSPVVNHTLKEDVETQEYLLPTEIVTLFSLNTQKMLERYDQLKQTVTWHLLGKSPLTLNQEGVYNCSSYIEEILKAGGIYEGLLSDDNKSWGIKSPKSVLELTAKAATIEAEKYPDRDKRYEDFLDIYVTKVLEKSSGQEDPIQAIESFLKENPDFFLQLNKFNPKALTLLIKSIYSHIQNHYNQALLELAQEYPSTHVNDATFLAKLDNLLSKGANLSSYNIDGYNALHIMIKKNHYLAVEKILRHDPLAAKSAVMNECQGQWNQTSSIDLAFQNQNLQIFALLQKYESIASDYFTAIKYPSNYLFGQQRSKTSTDSNKSDAMSLTNNQRHYFKNSV